MILPSMGMVIYNIGIVIPFMGMIIPDLGIIIPFMAMIAPVQRSCNIRHHSVPNSHCYDYLPGRVFML